MKNSDTNTSQAEVVALGILQFLASEPEHFSRFLSLTGLSPQDISGQAGEPAFLASVMDYLLSDEKLLLEFAENDSLQPQIIVNLRQKLPGATHI
ncbi:MAG: DUF3572 domain-containing protein [Hyphomicrobiales bacterium]|nr:DUF3572 domain-containing protein [Hyphomicrobiales bacterium]